MEVQKMFLAMMWGIFEGPLTNSEKPPPNLKCIFILSLLSDINKPCVCEQN